MPSLNIRGLPDDVHLLLKREAEASHRSLTSVVLEALTLHAESLRRRQRMERALTELDELREEIRLRVGMTSDSAELLREDRGR